MNYKLNANKSLDDNRDWLYQNKNSNILPSIIDFRPQLQPVRNQGTQGTCYAQSAACMKELQELNDYGLDEYLSPQFFYNNRDYWNNGEQDGDDINEDYGMTGRDVMRILQHVGICKESEYSYGTIDKIDEIPEYLKITAADHKIKNYARVNSLIDLKSSLSENGACLIAFPVYNYSDQLWIQNNDEAMVGGHAMTVVGYDDEQQHFIIRNSWGENWGHDGYCYYKYQDWGSHWECWTTIDVDTIMNSESDQESDIDSDNLDPEKPDNDNLEPEDPEDPEEPDNDNLEPEEPCVLINNGSYKIITEGPNYGLLFTAYEGYITFQATTDVSDLFFWDGEFYKSDTNILYTYYYHDDDTTYILKTIDCTPVKAELFYPPEDSDNESEKNNCWKWFKKMFKH